MKQVAIHLACLAIMTSACGGESSFNGSVQAGSVAPGKAATQAQPSVPQAQPSTVSADAGKPSPSVLPSADSRPPAPETFNECDKFSDTNMVARVSEIKDIKNANGEVVTAMKHFPFDLEKFYLSKPEVDSTVCLKNLDIGLTSFSSGFPGAPSLQEWFALDISFTLIAPETGEYSFSMNSDDGSAINIDGKQLEFQQAGEKSRKFLWGMDGHNRPENFGRQANTVDGGSELVPAVATEKVQLMKGQKYPVRVLYYQGPKFNIMLDMKWVVPGTSKAVTIPLANIQKPS